MLGPKTKSNSQGLYFMVSLNNYVKIIIIDYDLKCLNILK